MKYSAILLVLFSFANCYNKIKEVPKYNPNKTVESSFNVLDTDDYELLLPSGDQKGVLILFPGYPETPARIKQEFKIIERN